MPLVSFILPAYKRLFLHEAIASILAQTYTDFELVVVDDCSPEDLKSIVDDFHDERLTYHRNAENLGGKSVVAAWNHAMEYATGEWCVLASDDDIYDKDYLKEMISLSERYPKVDIFHCRIGIIDEEGKTCGYSLCHAEYESIWEFLYTRGIRRVDQMAPEFMSRRSALKAIGGFIDFPRAISSDDATWYALAREHGVVCSGMPLFSWRYSGINICSLNKDIDLKIEATLQFKKWLLSFTEDLLVKNEMDGVFRKIFQHDVHCVYDGLWKSFYNECPLLRLPKVTRILPFGWWKRQKFLLKAIVRKILILIGRLF